MRLSIYVGVSLVALAAGILIAQVAAPPPSPPVTATGDARVTDRPLFDLNGARRALREWKGKVVLVNFWATWCAPCREEIPHLQQARERYSSRGFEVIGIAVDEADAVRDYRDELAIRYPLLLAADGSGQWLSAFGNEQGVLPYSVILGSTGNVLATHVGPLSEAQVTALIEPYL